MDYERLLFEKYGAMLLTAKQVSEVTGRSVFSLGNDRRNGTGIAYKRTSSADNAPVRYPIGEVAKFLQQVERTAS